jgi:Domain of unknown function (DUF5615)
MKILLDECVTKRFKKHITSHTVLTVFECGWSGTKNGALMKLCEENGFDVFLTIDKNLLYQQNYSNFKPSIIVFDCESSKLECLVDFIPKLDEALLNLKPNTSIVINL